MAVDSEPLSRNEIFLQACCNQCGCEDLPEPITRKEQLLYQLAELLKDENEVSE